MATYQRTIHDEDGDVIGVKVTQFGKPTPAHALTPSAEAARQALRDQTPAKAPRLTRRDVEAAYVHPAPERVAEVISLAEASKLSKGAATFAARCQDAGADVKLTAARGTTLPPKLWKSTDPPDPADYHGDVVDSVVVWARRHVIGSPVGHEPHARIRVKAEWHGSKNQSTTLNGQRSTLKAALEALS